MGAMTAAIVGMGVAQAGTQMIGGMMQNKEAQRNATAIQQQSNYNAGVYMQQAGMVTQQKNLKIAQDNRAIRFAEGKHTAITSAKGIEMSGSPMAILIDTITQMEMDKAITAYNYDIERYSLKSQAQATAYQGASLAAAYRRGGRDAMIGGFMGGLTTLAGTALYAGARTYGTKPSINTEGGIGSRISTTYNGRTVFGVRHA